MKRLISVIRGNIYAVTCLNLLMVMFLYTLCRAEFYVVNMSDYFPNMGTDRLRTLMLGGLKFDLSAVLYSNLLYIVMMLIPFRFRYKTAYQTITKWIFIIVNAIAIFMNLSDSVYFKFTNRRTTMSFFTEFQNDDNLFSILGQGMLNYWYVTVTGIVLIVGLVVLYVRPSFNLKSPRGTWWYYVRNIIAFGVAGFLSVNGMRGGFGSFVRPITLSNANVYTEKPLEASIVLNTPFCLLRTIGKKPYKNPEYFKDEKELAKEYEPIIYPHPRGEFREMNVVIFILESFSKEFVGELNRDLKNADGSPYKGYTPFLDSLIRQGLTFEYTFATGRKSIDAMPSVLSSIPRYYEPYVLTSYSNNRVSGIADVLGKKGYYTAFFHGAPNGSMGFESFAKVSGFQAYYGKTEYGNDADYDGTWAIWDEPFFQFFATKMSTFRQPFMTALFSASSHDPFRIPSEYERVYPEDGIHKIHKCVRYTDNALRKFFDTAKQQPWYENTLFVITADHTNALTRKEYINDAGHYKVPIIFYTPNGDLRGRLPVIAEQTDIMPTVLGYLNYEKPYFAFGHDVLDPNYAHHYALNHNDQIFQLFTDSLMLQFDGQQTKAVYNFVKDTELQHNILPSVSRERLNTMEKRMKAVIQQYVVRMIENRLTVE